MWKFLVHFVKCVAVFGAAIILVTFVAAIILVPSSPNSPSYPAAATIVTHEAVGTVYTSAPALTSTRAEADGRRMVLTYEAYQGIRAGDDLSDVEAKFGPGREMSRVDMAGAPLTVMYSWEGPNPLSSMTAMFQDGKLISKAQLGLTD